MKTAILSLGLSLSFLAPTVFAGEEIDYTAKLNEDGKFCATVKVERIGFGNGYVYKKQVPYYQRLGERWLQDLYACRSRRNARASAS